MKLTLHYMREHRLAKFSADKELFKSVVLDTEHELRKTLIESLNTPAGRIQFAQLVFEDLLSPYLYSRRENYIENKELVWLAFNPSSLIDSQSEDLVYLVSMSSMGMTSTFVQDQRELRKILILFPEVAGITIGLPERTDLKLTFLPWSLACKQTSMDEKTVPSLFRPQESDLVIKISSSSPLEQSPAKK